MGRTANHAMVIAQLVIDGKQYGIHNFIVPIRGDDHLPLPGVRVGDIGPKIGFNTMDNGFCSFDRVRIPRGNMAMRHQRVDRDGVYASFGSKESGKIAYISMMQVRVVIAKDAGRSLAKAATIATRYSIVRRQGFREGSKEHQVLDYTIQMHRLLPLIASAYGFHFAGVDLNLRLRRLEREHVHGLPPLAGGKGAGDTLKQFHATSSCLKGLCSGLTAAGIEDCRKACGGHGYLQSSGLPELLGNYLQSCTVEGENHMLTQQVVRVLLQELAAARQSGAVGNDCAYMSRLVRGEGKGRRRCPVRSPKGFRDSVVLEAALEHRAFRLLVRVEARLRSEREAGSSPAEAWNLALIEIYRASHAHACLLVFKAFKEVVDAAGDSASDDAPVHQDDQPQHALDGHTSYALELLLLLLGLYWLQNDMGDFVEDGFLDGDQAGWVRDQVVEVLHLLRPMAVSLVDAWDLSDFQLNSALGRFDGRAYEALLETTERNPLNGRDPVQGYEEHLEPVIRGAREARLAAEAATGAPRDPRGVAGPRAKL